MRGSVELQSERSKLPFQLLLLMLSSTLRRRHVTESKATLQDESSLRRNNTNNIKTEVFQKHPITELKGTRVANSLNGKFPRLASVSGDQRYIPAGVKRVQTNHLEMFAQQ